MALESRIAQLVEAFIAAGRPSSREQNIDDRRAGYIASTVLAGDTETRVQVEDIELDAMMFRVVSPRGLREISLRYLLSRRLLCQRRILPLMITS